MDKTFFRCVVLSLVVCIVSWCCPNHSMARSAREGIGESKAVPGKVDGSNHKILFSSSKSTPLFSKKPAELSSECLTVNVPEENCSNLKNNEIPHFKQTGIASWYGEKFNGKKTASGELSNIKAMVASHKTLPFGTMVEVKNDLTGQSVIVRINDRGPFVNGRIINLSRSAAEKINIIEKGVAKVTIRTVPTIK